MFYVSETSRSTEILFIKPKIFQVLNYKNIYKEGVWKNKHSEFDSTSTFYITLLLEISKFGKKK